MTGPGPTPASEEVCPGCGAAVALGDDAWCGRCGAWLGHDSSTSTSRHGVAAGASVGLPASVEERTVRPSRAARGRRRAVAVAVLVGAVALTTVVADRERSAGPPTSPEPVVLVGRLDDATGRSSDSDPPRTLRRRWTAPSPTDRLGDVPRFPVLAVGDDAVAIGDRVLSLDDGRVLGPAGQLARLGDGLTPDGLLGVLDGDALLLLEPIGQRVVARTPIAVDPPRGPVGGRATVLIGWVDRTAVLRTWDVGLGSSTTRGVDRDTGGVVWESFVDSFAPVGEGWFLGVAAQGPVLVDGRSGALVGVPGEIAPHLLGEPVVVDGAAYAATDRGVAVWDASTGALRWWEDRAGTDDAAVLVDELLVEVRPSRGDGVAVRWLDQATGSPERVAWVELAGGRVETATYPGIGVLDDVVTIATRDGVRGLRRDGRTWDVDVPGLLGVAVADGADVVVAVASDRPAPGPVGAPRGDVEAIVLDTEGSQLLRATVGPASSVPPATIVAVVDDVVVIDDAATFEGQRVVSLAERAPVSRTATMRAWAGGEDVLGAHVIGTVAGAPGGGVGPLLWRPADSSFVGALIDLPIGDGPAAASPVVVDLPSDDGSDGRGIAVAAGTGTSIVGLPAGAAGTTVDDGVRAAVGVRRVDDAPRRRGSSVVRAVPGLEPLAGVAGLLLTARPGTGAAATGRPLVAVDPADARVRWESDVTVSPAWPATATTRPSRFGPPDAAVLHDDGTPIVVVDGARITALGAQDGGRRWGVDLAELAVTDATIVGGAVVVALPTTVAAFDVVTGAERWRHALDGLVTTLTGAGTTAVVGTAAGVVVVLDRAGDVVDRLDLGPTAVDDVAVVGDELFVLTADRRLTVLGRPDGTIGRDDEVRVR